MLSTRMSKSTKLDVDKELAKLDELRKLRNISLDELFTLIEYLKVNYDPERSLKVIACLSARMESDDYVPPELLQALIKHAFALIVEGRTADQAFGLKPVKGQYPRLNNELRNMQAAALVFLQMRKDNNWENSVTDVAEAMELNDSVVRRAYSEYKDVFFWLPNETLEDLAGNLQLPS